MFCLRRGAAAAAAAAALGGGGLLQRHWSASAQQAPVYGSPGAQGHADAEQSKTTNSIKSPAEVYQKLLLKKRIIMLNGSIDDTSSARVMTEMLHLEAKDPQQPIVLIINSGGGKVHSALAMIDVMEAIDAPVYTSCFGRAESAAAVLLAAGEQGHRCISKHSRVMIHQPSRVGSGRQTAQAALVAVTELNRINMLLATLIADRSNVSREWVADTYKDDTYMTAEEALKCQLVDSICTNPLALAGSPPDEAEAEAAKAGEGEGSEPPAAAAPFVGGRPNKSTNA